MPLIFTPPLDASGAPIEPIVFSFSLHPPGLNSSGGLMRMHWASRNQQQALWDVRIRQDMSARLLADKRLPLKLCEIVYTVRGRKPIDWDNLASSFKMMGDALKHNKVIIDDKPSVILVLYPRWVQVEKQEVGCEVQIYPLA